MTSELKPIDARAIVAEARGHLKVALIQSIDSDDQIIMSHVRTAKEFLDQVIVAQGPTPIGSPHRQAGTVLPCPFCGGPARTQYIRDGRQAVCRDCHASGPPEFNGRADQPSADDRAAEAWNRRADPEPASPENSLP